MGCLRLPAVTTSTKEHFISIIWVFAEVKLFTILPEKKQILEEKLDYCNINVFSSDILTEPSIRSKIKIFFSVISRNVNQISKIQLLFFMTECNVGFSL